MLFEFVVKESFMDTYYIVVFFIFGLLFGSFFNVVGLRVPKKLSFITDRSYCPTCKQQLRAPSLIPVLSYLLQGGKCKECQTPIAKLYPVIELLTAILFAFSYYKIGFQPELITAILFISMLMILFVTDMNYMLIPNKILLFFLPLFIIMRIITPLTPWYSPLIGASVGFLLVAIIIIVSRGGMGGGDMKLFGVIGIVLGFPKVLLAFFLSTLIGAIIGGMLLLLKVIERKQPIPFGPYIIIATLITYFFGEPVIDWYFSLIK